LASRKFELGTGYPSGFCNIDEGEKKQKDKEIDDNL